MEIWKDVLGYKGLYQVSNYGNIKSLSFGPKNICLSNTEQLLKTSKSSTGYVHVQLYKDGKSKTVNVHRLVANAFVKNPFNKPEVNHIDANRSNNHADNLEWVTHSENLKHAVKTGNRIPPSIKNSNLSLCHILQYSLNGQFVKEWNCIDDISHSLNFRRNNIISCIKGFRKSSYGYIWKWYIPGSQIETNIPPRISLTGKTEKECRKIGQCDIHGNLIKIWSSYKEIQKDINFGAKSIGNICKCAGKKRESAYGFIWEYI